MSNNDNDNNKMPRTENKLYYHYKLKHDSNNNFEYFKSCKEITEKYNISRSNIYLMCKNPKTPRRKYNNIKIEKIHLHYLIIDSNVSESQILI